MVFVLNNKIIDLNAGSDSRKTRLLGIPDYNLAGSARGPLPENLVYYKGRYDSNNNDLHEIH